MYVIKSVQRKTKFHYTAFVLHEYYSTRTIRTRKSFIYRAILIIWKRLYCNLGKILCY